jgi:4'-phosphopantetheinyl transferase
MRVDALDEAAVAPWCAILDPDERERAARFVFPRHRVQFIAAHALTRAALGWLLGCPPSVWRFVSSAHGKPAAYLGNAQAPVSFNLSHTEGMVGIAAIAGADRELGLDLEPITREVSLSIADQFFRPEEVAWLDSLAASDRLGGFLRLWTLKEAFIKATGKGLTQDLASFWFEPCPPRIHFAETMAQRAAVWWFEQRHLEGGFVAALGLRRAVAESAAASWITVEPDNLTINGLSREVPS